MSLHQEETKTPWGVHCPEACLPHSRSVTTIIGVPSPSQQNVAHACLFATPARIPTVGHRLLHLTAVLGCHLEAVCVPPAWADPPRRAYALVTPQVHCSVSERLFHTQGHGSFGCLVIYHLAHGRLTRIQRLFGAETFSTPVLNHTQRGVSTLHPMEYSLLQPRSAPEDTPAGVNPSLNSDLPSPSTQRCSALLPQRRRTVRQIQLH